MNDVLHSDLPETYRAFIKRYAAEYYLLAIIRFFIAIFLWISYTSENALPTIEPGFFSTTFDGKFALLALFTIYSASLLVPSLASIETNHSSRWIFIQITLDLFFVTAFFLVEQHTTGYYPILYFLPVLLFSRLLGQQAVIRLYSVTIALYILTALYILIYLAGDSSWIIPLLNIFAICLTSFFLLAFFLKYNIVKNDDLERSRRVERQLIALSNISKAIQSETNLDDLLDNVSKSATELLGGDSGGVLLLAINDAKEKVLKFRGSYRVDPKEVENTEDKIGESIAGRVFEQKELILVPDVQNSTIFNNPAARQKYKTIISAPLIFQNEIIGTLDVHSKTRTNAFSKDEHKLFLESMAAQAAIAITKIRKQEYTESLIENAFSAIVAADPEGNIEEFNKMAEEVLIWKKEEIKGEKVDLIYYEPKMAKEVMRKLRSLKASGGRTLINHRTYLKAKDGEKIPIRLSASLTERGSVGYFRDQRTVYQIDKIRAVVHSILGDIFNFQETLQAITHYFIELLEEDDLLQERGKNNFYCGLLIEQEKGYLDYVATSPESQIDNIDDKYKRIDLANENFLGIAGHVFKTQELEITKDVSQNDYYTPSNELTKSQLTVPIIVNSKAVGVIIVEHTETDAFSAEDANIISFLAQFAGVAIQNGKRIEDLNAIRGAVQRIANLTISSSITEEELNDIAELIKGVMKCDVVTIHPYDETTGEFDHEFGCAGPLNREDMRIGDSLPKNSVLYRVIKSNKEQIIADDIQTEPLLRSNFTKREEIKSALAIPLRVLGRKVGALFISYRSNHRFNNSDLDNCKLFAHQAAIIIANNKLLKDLQSAEALATIGLLYGEDLHLSANKLGAASQFARDIITHAKDLERAKELASYISINIKSFLDLIEVNLSTVKPPVPKNFDLMQCIREVVRASPPNPGIKVSFKLAQEKMILFGLERQISQVFRVIVHNALEAMQGRGELTLQVELARRNGLEYARVFVSDTGHGIPKKKIPDLFKIKYPRFKSTGLGIGLGWTSNFLDRYGGYIALENSTSEGTTFSVDLPRDYTKTADISLKRLLAK